MQNTWIESRYSAEMMANAYSLCLTELFSIADDISNCLRMLSRAKASAKPGFFVVDDVNYIAKKASDLLGPVASAIDLFKKSTSSLTHYEQLERMQILEYKSINVNTIRDMSHDVVSVCDSLLLEMHLKNSFRGSIEKLKMLADNRIQWCNTLTQEVDATLRIAPINEGVPKLLIKAIRGRA